MNEVEEIVSCLRNLADAKFQESVWVNGEGNVPSSFAEESCQLFDDTGLGDALEDGSAKDWFDGATLLQFQKFEAQIRRVDEELEPRELVDSQAMQDVREMATELLGLLVGE